MSEAAAPAPKLCSICGVDCGGKQRAKDPNGRYLCMDCVARAKEARAVQTAPKPAPASRTAAPAAPAEEDNSFLLDMGATSSIKPDDKAKPCPSCFKPVPEKALVCMNCGFNAKTGEQLKVRVLKAKEDPAAKSANKGYSPIHDVPDWAWVLGVSAIAVVPAFVGFFMASPVILTVGVLSYLISAAVVHLLVTISAFKAGVGLQFFFIPFYQFYYIFTDCENEVYKKLWMILALAPWVLIGCGAIFPETANALDAAANAP